MGDIRPAYKLECNFLSHQSWLMGAKRAPFLHFLFLMETLGLLKIYWTGIHPGNVIQQQGWWLFPLDETVRCLPLHCSDLWGRAYSLFSQACLACQPKSEKMIQASCQVPPFDLSLHTAASCTRANWLKSLRIAHSNIEYRVGHCVAAGFFTRSKPWRDTSISRAGRQRRSEEHIRQSID